MLTVVVPRSDPTRCSSRPSRRSVGATRGTGAGGHDDTVGAALLWTLGQGLGSAFTDEVRDAWAEAYGVLG